MSEEKLNAKQYPKMYYARHMQPGLVGYQNETLLVDVDALKRMLPSFIGRPVYMGHQPVDLENIKIEADGYITESFYNELDGWAWAKFIAIEDEAHHANAKGMGVSNAYIPKNLGGGGTKNNCPYDREVLDGEFTHLAIVEDPRYEEACILTPDEFKIYQTNKKQQLSELRNSKTEKGASMKFFKNRKEETNEIDAETVVEITNEKGEKVEVSIKDMTDAVLNAKKSKKNESEDEDDDKEEKMNEKTEVTVGSEKMQLGVLIERYNALKAKKNESEDDKDDKEEKENEEDEEDDKKEKSNSKSKKEKAPEPDVDGKRHFEELRNARGKESGTVTLDTPQAKLARGNEMFGSGK